MKRNRYLWIIALVMTFLAIAIPGYSRLRPKSDTLFQTSTISALLEGIYDGETTYKALKHYGNFGLGTFNGLDGEMIGLEGKFYQIKTDGVAYPVADSMKTPFATVTFFQPEQSILLKEAMNFKGDWGLGTGYWVLGGIEDGVLLIALFLGSCTLVLGLFKSTLIPNPQFPIPNPGAPIPPRLAAPKSRNPGRDPMNKCSNF